MTGGLGKRIVVIHAKGIEPAIPPPCLMGFHSFLCAVPRSPTRTCAAALCLLNGTAWRSSFRGDLGDAAGIAFAGRLG